VHREQQQVLREPQPVHDQQEGRQDEGDLLLFAPAVQGRDLEDQDLEEQPGHQDLAEVAGEDLPVPHHEQGGAQQDVDDEDDDPVGAAGASHAAEPAEREQQHQEQHPTEGPVVLRVEMALQSQGLGQQHELVEGGRFHRARPRTP
jgi:hypothetical protein